MSTVGIIANPAAGKDIRRLISQSRFISNQEKINIVRRVLVGLGSMGVDKVILMPDQSNLARASIDDLQTDIEFSFLDMPIFNAEIDTTRAASMMEETGVKAIVSLGGDGTNRAITKGTNQIPLMPISTGTNNVFPFMVDPTVAGTAAGLIASDELIIEEVSQRAKVIHVELPNGIKDLALVDVVLVDDRLTGSRAVVKPDSVKQVLAAIANPASIGLASIAGRSKPVYFDDESAVSVICDPKAKQGVFAPIMPGSVSDVGIVDIKEVELGETIELNGPGVLAFDGERDFVMGENESAKATVLRNGPKVINPNFAVQTAAANKVFLRKRNS